MPKKENGFGKAQSFAFKSFDKTDKGKGKGAAGYYPSNRQYGSAISRSVMEKYDLDSDWVKWRKGYEYYNKAAWYRLETYNDICRAPAGALQISQTATKQVRLGQSSIKVQSMRLT